MSAYSTSDFISTQQKIDSYSKINMMIATDIKRDKIVYEFQEKCNTFLMENLNLPQLEKYSGFQQMLKHQRTYNAN